MRRTIIDTGSGPTVLALPGIQGRWEYMRPTVDALAEVCRVITFSLAGERGSGRRFDPALGFDNYVEQIDDAMVSAAVTRVVLLGISAGGRIALRYAAERPERVSGLVLASALGPIWRPDAHLAGYMAAPTLSALPFFAGSRRRLRPEVRAAYSSRLAQQRFLLRQLRALVLAPLSPRRMAERAALVARVDQTADCARVSVPTLVVTGERALDRVVPVEQTLEYVRLISSARAVTIGRTGHLGAVTRADVFASIVRAFIDTDVRAAEGARRNREVA